MNKKKKSLGFTLIELLVVFAVIALLLAMVVPDYVGRLKRAEEAVLKENLVLMRDALDKHYADAGVYPNALEDLVTKRYLRSIPVDPFTQNTSWVIVPPSDTKKGRIWDVKSAAKGYERW
jgi:general secretion pathway protein G